MDPMAGADLDIRGIQEEVLLLRMRFALLSLGLICRVCNCRSSSKVHAEAHERSDGHYEVLDARAHHATMMPFHAVPFCTVCGTVPDDVDAHCAGKGHRKALKVEAESWSARFVILSICNELRRRNLEVPEWCPVELSRAQRFRRAAEGCTAKVAAAGVADGDLAGTGLGAATDVAHGGRARDPRHPANEVNLYHSPFDFTRSSLRPTASPSCTSRPALMLAPLTPLSSFLLVLGATPHGSG